MYRKMALGCHLACLAVATNVLGESHEEKCDIANCKSDQCSPKVRFTVSANVVRKFSNDELKGSPEEKLSRLRSVDACLKSIVRDHPHSDLALRLASADEIGIVSLERVKDEVARLDRSIRRKATMDLFYGPVTVWGHGGAERKVVQGISAYFADSQRRGNFVDIRLAGVKYQTDVKDRLLDTFLRVDVGRHIEKGPLLGVGLTSFRHHRGSDSSQLSTTARVFGGAYFGDSFFGGFDGKIFVGAAYDEFWREWADNTRGRLILDGTILSMETAKNGTAVGARLEVDMPYNSVGSADVRLPVFVRQDLNGLRKFIPK